MIPLNEDEHAVKVAQTFIRNTYEKVKPIYWQLDSLKSALKNYIDKNEPQLDDWQRDIVWEVVEYRYRMDND